MLLFVLVSSQVQFTEAIHATFQNGELLSVVSRNLCYCIDHSHSDVLLGISDVYFHMYSTSRVYGRIELANFILLNEEILVN